MTAADVIAAIRISEVWTELGGDPPRHGQARAFWREGDNPQAVSLNDEKRCWYDHRDQVGGGVLDLVQHVRGCSRTDALRYVADLAGLSLGDRSFTPAQRREYGHRRAQANRLVPDLSDFERGLEVRLRRRQHDAAKTAEESLYRDQDPDESLFNANRDVAALQGADADSIVKTYLGLSESARRRFIEAGRTDREDAEGNTHAIVRILTEAERLRREDVTT